MKRGRRVSWPETRFPKSEWSDKIQPGDKVIITDGKKNFYAYIIGHVGTDTHLVGRLWEQWHEITSKETEEGVVSIDSSWREEQEENNARILSELKEFLVS